MTEVYSKNELEVIAKKQKNTMTLAIALPSIAFVLAVVFCFLADTDTLSIFKAKSADFFSLSFSFLIGSLRSSSLIFSPQDS